MIRPARAAAAAGLAAVALVVAVLAPASHGHDVVQAVKVIARPLPSFRIGRPEETTFGALEWIGGFAVVRTSPAVGGLSGLIIREEGGALTAVTDDGRVVVAAIERDGNGVPVGWSNARVAHLATTDPDLFDGHRFDAEGFDSRPGESGSTVAISVEGVSWFLTGALEEDGFVGPLEATPLPDEIPRLHQNRGLEALAMAPADGPLAGRVLVLSEVPAPGDASPDRPGWILGGEKPVAFRVRDSGYDITDAAFGPDGDLYLLERSFSLLAGVAMRMRRIAAADLTEGAVVDGPEIIAADMAHQIDNMEALAIWSDADGRTIVSLLSDDNRSFMQRTVYLEFVMADR